MIIKTKINLNLRNVNPVIAARIRKKRETQNTKI